MPKDQQVVPNLRSMTKIQNTLHHERNELMPYVEAVADHANASNEMVTQKCSCPSGGDT